MTCKLLGRYAWSGGTDEQANRIYKMQWLVETDTKEDGPARALNCPGLPTIGSSWIFGNDTDTWALCQPNWNVTYGRDVTPGEPNFHWLVEQTFSTKISPYNPSYDNPTNPLAAPIRVGGSFVKYTEEATEDKDGKPIRSSSFERLRGPMVEFDANRPTVSIGLNVAFWGLSTFAPLVDIVNDSSLWGLPARCVKLSNVRWTRNVYGFGYFYTIDYDFDIRYDTFDREVPDMGMKELAAGGTASNASHYQDNGDRLGAKGIVRYLKNHQYWDGTGDPDKIKIQKYKQSNFLVLGIPTSF
jgi:hypothetical protein